MSRPLSLDSLTGHGVVPVAPIGRVSTSAKEEAIVSFRREGLLLDCCVRQFAKSESPVWVCKVPEVLEFRHSLARYYRN